MARMTSVQRPVKRQKTGPRPPGVTNKGHPAFNQSGAYDSPEESAAEVLSAEAKQINDMAYTCKTKQNFLRTVLVDIHDKNLVNEIQRIIDVPIETSCPISIIGETGSGKSTLLSAMGGYPGLLPTGDMGDAVTAVPVNFFLSSDPQWNFTGEFKYTSEEEWREVLEAALCTIQDSESDEPSSSGPVARVKAVYRSIKPEDLPHMSVELLLAHDDVKNDLGRLETVRENDTSTFNKELFKRVATSIKANAKATWALISTADVYINPIDDVFLSFGQEPRDLPGSGDENAARAERYQSCMRSSRVLCICTRADRANAQKEYRGLVKRAIQQFQYDDRLDRIVLICTQFDQTSVEHIRQQVDDPELEERFKQREFAKQELEQHSQDLQTARLGLETKKNDIELVKKGLRPWRSKRTAIKNGTAKKPIKIVEHAVNASYLDASQLSVPLNLESAEYAVSTLEKAHASLVADCKCLPEEITQGEARLIELSSALSTLDKECNRATIGARIEHISQRQAEMFLSLVQDCLKARRDVEEAVKTENDMAEDEEFYNKVRDNLKVFCTSAIAYQDLSGLATLENAQRVILDIEDSGVPRLMNHLQTIAMNVRMKHLKRLDRELETAFHSLQNAVTRNPSTLPSQAKNAKMRIAEFRIELDNFPGLVEGCLTNTTTSVKISKKKHLTQLRATTSKTAAVKVIEKLKPYAAQPDTGLYFQEWRAVCRNKGIWDGKRALDVNLNRDVAEVLRLSVDRRIKTLFTSNGKLQNDVRSVKQALEKCCAEVLDLMKDLHLKFQGPATLVGTHALTIGRMNEQLERRKLNVRRTVEDFKQRMEDIVIDVFDSITRDIYSMYLKAYKTAAEIKGENTRARIIAELNTALIRDNILRTALERLEDRLMEKAVIVLNDLAHELRVMATSMAADYEHAVQQQDAELVSQDRKPDRAAMDRVLKEIELYKQDKSKWSNDKRSMIRGTSVSEAESVHDYIEEPDCGAEEEANSDGVVFKEETVKREDGEDSDGVF